MLEKLQNVMDWKYTYLILFIGTLVFLFTALISALGGFK